jgi:hypothetical protein
MHVIVPTGTTKYDAEGIASLLTDDGIWGAALRTLCGLVGSYDGWYVALRVFQLLMFHVNFFKPQLAGWANSAVSWTGNPQASGR